MEANKIIGAVLLGLLVWRGLDFVADLTYGTEHAGEEHEPAYLVAAAEGEDATETGAGEEPVPLGVLLADADPSAGQSDAKKCAACHTFEEGGANGIGPNLWNVVGRDKAGLDDFAYSPVLADLEGDWTYEDLGAFLESPKAYAPGTKMAFPGIGRPEDLADMIAYLRTLSDSPPPLPEVTESADAVETVSGEEIPSPAAGSATETEAESAEIAEGRVEAEQAAEDEAAAGQAPAGDPAAESVEEPAAEAPAAEEETAAPAADAEEAPASATETEQAGEPAPEDAVPAEPAAEETAAAEPMPEETAATEPAADQQAAEAPAENGGEESAFASMVAAADPAAGEKASRICSACHKFEQDAGSGIGPNLHDVVGRDIAGEDGFNYSKALQGVEGDWTVDSLNDFLADPRSFAPGNKMAFPGIRDEQSRADVVAFLRSLGAQ